jgi:hypothetical protein
MNIRTAQAACLASSAFALLPVAACGGDTQAATHTEANAGVSSDAASGGAVASGASPGTSGEGGMSGSGGKSQGGGRINEGGSDGASFGTGGSAGRDASLDSPSGAGGHAADATSPGADAGPTPPTYCVAPCVWDVVKKCVPILRSCVTEKTFANGLRTCDRATGWTRFVGAVGPKQGRESVSHDGATCFSWDSNAVVFVSTLTDGSGRQVALKPSGGPVYCGVTLAEYFDYTNNHIVDGGLEFPDGNVAVSYPQDPSNPECAAWDSTGLPVLPPCETAEAGTCN